MITHQAGSSLHRRPADRHFATLAAGLALSATLAALLVLLLAAGPAGAATNRVWERRYAPTAGSDRWDYIAKGPSNTVYVAGWRNAEASTQRLMVAKYTSSGRRVWARSFAGRAGAWASGLAVDGRGRAYVVGGEYYPGSIDSHICLLKLASRNGKRIWLKRYDTPRQTGSDGARSIALGPKGAVYVSGTTLTSDRGWDALLLKFTDKGSRAVRSWVRTYGSAGAPQDHNSDDGRRVVVDGAGRVYWGGSSDRTSGRTITFLRRVKVRTGKPSWTRYMSTAPDPGIRLQLADLAKRPGGGVILAAVSSTPGSSLGAFVARYTPSGTLYFSRVVDSVHDEYVADLDVSGSGRIVLAGYRIDSSTHVQSAWVACGDRAFNSVWQRTYDSPDAGQPAQFHAVEFGPGDTVYCVGQARVGFITGVDFMLVKYNTTGPFLWADAYDDYVNGSGNKLDAGYAVLYVGGSKPALYGAGYGGATNGGEALLIRYKR